MYWRLTLQLSGNAIRQSLENISHFEVWNLILFAYGKKYSRFFKYGATAAFSTIKKILLLKIASLLSTRF